MQPYWFNDWPQLSRIGPCEIIDGVLFESYSAIARIGLTMIVLTIAYVSRNPFRICFARRLCVWPAVHALTAAWYVGE
ncbi:MAG: hypothetical protein WBZ42_04145 [Halobacteriota archaeon]